MTNELLPRQPIVVVLGHVDHGKTSLLDRIRNSNIASREAGGITQSIGASIIETKKKEKITFIDTPGHAVFTNMRSRGATAADIAILVVAADDGVKPQTKEALEAIRHAKIPFVVALTKVDLNTANPENALRELEQNEVYFEKRGGETPYVEVSSKSGKGIDDLLDLIVLLAEVSDIKASKEGNLEAVVIENVKDKRGLSVSVIVKNGTLKVGDLITTGKVNTKVRGLFGEGGKPIKNVLPGEPAQILGFDELPEVGSVISHGTSENIKEVKIHKDVSYEEELRPKIIIKTKKAGTMEALTSSIPQDVMIVGTGVGDINESDILFAKSAGAVGIYSFESKASPQVMKLAEAEGVNVFTFDVIYSLIDQVKELGKKEETIVLGKANIIAIFPFDNKKVAGSKVIEKRISKGDKLTLLRNDKKIGEVKVISLRKKKEEVTSVSEGDECGIIFVPQLDFAVGDVLVSTKT